MEKTLSIEELLAKVSEKEKPRRRIENNSNALRYISETGWESGTMLIPNYVLFWHYRTQWKCDRHYKANKIVFFRTFNQRFPSTRTNSQRFYLLKEGIIELTPEILKEAKLYDKKEWGKKVRPSKQEGNESDET